MKYSLKLWFVAAGSALAVLLPLFAILAMNTGRVVQKSWAPFPGATHWGVLPGAFIEHRNCSVTIEHWYGGRSELLVYPSTHDRLQRGDWYYGQP
jgi:hypothetical protein